MNLRPKVGVLALSLELYETLAPGLRLSRENWMRKEVIPALLPKHDVLFDGALFQRSAIDTTIAEYEAKGIDALLVILLAYSPSQITLPALKRTRCPILIWNTQELQKVDDGFSLAQMIDNHGVHGTQDLSNVLIRSEVPFHFVTGHPGDPETLLEIEQFLSACAAVQKLRRSSFGLLGYPFPGMGDFALDTTHLVATLGCSCTVLPLQELISRSLATDINLTRALMASYRQAYSVAPDITEADLQSTANAELALRGMIEDHKLDGLSYQFTAFGDDERSATLPFVAASRMMADGIGFGGEGDLIATAGTCLLNWLHPPASFAEMFTIDFAGNSIFMSHMGEANTAMARRDHKIRLVARPTPITRTRDRQLALVVSFEPGPATLAALTLGPAQKWRVIASHVNIEDYGPLSSLCVPHFKMKPAGDVRQFLTAYAQSGGPHHLAVCFGDARPQLRFACKLMQADYLEV